MKRLLMINVGVCWGGVMLAMCCAPALAGDPAGDSKIKQFWADVAKLQKAGPKSPYAKAFKSKYGMDDAQLGKIFTKKPVLTRPFGERMDLSMAIAVCQLEFWALGIGAIVWETRRVMDRDCYGYKIENATQYCRRYSTTHNHYVWCKGMLPRNQCNAPCDK